MTTKGAHVQLRKRFKNALRAAEHQKQMKEHWMGTVMELSKHLKDMDERLNITEEKLKAFENTKEQYSEALKELADTEASNDEEYDSGTNE